ncbi:MAG: MaoC family dehydratase N-terminal domain-containing protein [Pseudomonadales bacterium]|nr:MaoC family dehydratase N-terminal domain-containing protein [Pseudomonadales bacterium]
MLDRNKIGHEFERFSVDVEKGRIKMFSNAIGENNPIYTNEKSAFDAGYETIPAPPTFLFVLDMETKDVLPVINILNIDIGKILHGSQEFEYFHMVYVKDVITVTSKIIDIFDKKNGALEFVVIENSYTNQNNDLVANSKNTLVYRNEV